MFVTSFVTTLLKTYEGLSTKLSVCHSMPEYANEYRYDTYSTLEDFDIDIFFQKGVILRSS